MLSYIVDFKLHYGCQVTLQMSSDIISPVTWQMSSYITYVRLHYGCQVTLQMSSYITYVRLHYWCKVTLRMSGYITDVRLHYITEVRSPVERLRTSLSGDLLVCNNNNNNNAQISVCALTIDCKHILYISIRALFIDFVTLLLKTLFSTQQSLFKYK